MLQIHLLIHPQNHQKRENKQRLELEDKGHPVKKHGQTGAILKQIIKAQQQKGHEYNVTLGPERAVGPDGRHNQKQAVGQDALPLASGDFINRFP